MSEGKELVYTRVVCGVLIEKDNKYLLVQEKQKDVYGKWNWPAGKAEKGDSLEETAIKEAKEETGFDVKINKELKIYHESIERPVKHLYLAEVIGGNIEVPTDEILDVKWWSAQEVRANQNDMREVWVLDGIKIYESRIE